MPDGALRILSIGVLALLYLFFMRSLRAVWVETRPTPPRAEPKGPAPQRGEGRQANKQQKKNSPALLLIEPAARKGLRFDVLEEMTIGRSPGCNIVVEDTFASGVHTRVFRSGGKILAEDLGSTNGTFIDGERISSPQVLGRRQRLTVGKHVFEADL